MIELHDWFATFSTWWWPRLADHLWQATVFGVAIMLASLMLKRAPAHSRYSLWLLATAKFIVPAALLVTLAQSIGLDSFWIWLSNPDHNNPLLRGITEPVTALANSYAVTVVATDGAHNELYCALTVVWLSGCGVLLAAWRRGKNKSLQALKRSTSVVSGRESFAFERAKSLLGVRRPVQLMRSPQPVEPGVFNTWNPIILLPESIAEHLNDEELLTIMLHELVHVQRHDNLVGRLQIVLAGFFWFHPLVWLISRKLFDEREQACDEKVLETYSTPETYAAGILKVVRFSFGWKVAGVTGAGSGSNLRRRIDNIMATGKEKRRAGLAAKLLTTALLGVMLVAIVVAGTHPRGSVISDNQNDQDVVNTHDPVASLSQERHKDVQDPPLPPRTPAQPQLVNPSQSAAPASPSQPAAPASPSQPAAPSNPSQLPQPPAPENVAAPTNTAAPAQPLNPPQASVPDQLPAPPASPAGVQEKPEKSGKEKQDLKKGGLIEAPRPIYPPEAKEKKVEGLVTVSIVIGEEGTVISARPTSGPELLQGAAKDAALKARFHPTVVNGKPAKVSGAMTYNFVLDKKDEQ